MEAAAASLARETRRVRMPAAARATALVIGGRVSPRAPGGRAATTTTTHTRFKQESDGGRQDGDGVSRAVGHRRRRRRGARTAAALRDHALLDGVGLELVDVLLVGVGALVRVGVEAKDEAVAWRGGGTFFHRLPTAYRASYTGQARKNSTCHWPARPESGRRMYASTALTTGIVASPFVSPWNEQRTKRSPDPSVAATA